MASSRPPMEVGILRNQVIRLDPAARIRVAELVSGVDRGHTSSARTCQRGMCLWHDAEKLRTAGGAHRKGQRRGRRVKTCIMVEVVLVFLRSQTVLGMS